VNPPTGVAVLVIGDGRDSYLRRCVDSMGALAGNITEWWMHDDTGDRTYRAELAARYPGWRHINAGPRAGCAGAFQSCWAQLRAGSAADHIFLVEGDFEFFRPVDLDAIAGLLDDRPYLAEVALVRDPVNADEHAAGGVVECHPDWYTDMADGCGRQWLEQGAFYTTNPHLFRRTLLDIPWPEHRPGTYSESTFHQQLMTGGTPETPAGQVRYAYWGPRDSGVWVRHIGHERHTESREY
jgi:hypothetical protein